MDWGQHISDISSKVTKTLGFPRRNLAFAPRSTKEVAYITLVRPKLENTAPNWSSYCKTQIQQVEKVKRTSASWRGGATLVVLVRCSMGCNGQLWRPGGISFSAFLSQDSMSIDKNKYLTCLRVQDLPGHHTTHSIASPRLTVMP